MPQPGSATPTGFASASFEGAGRRRTRRPGDNLWRPRRSRRLRIGRTRVQRGRWRDATETVRCREPRSLPTTPREADLYIVYYVLYGIYMQMDAGKFVDRDEALRVLSGFNPWWAERPFQDEPFRRLAFHACRKYLQDSTLRRALLLSGPRRVGKTTISCTSWRGTRSTTRFGEAVDPKSILYLSLDHPLLKLLGLEGALRLYHEAIGQKGGPPSFSWMRCSTRETGAPRSTARRSPSRVPDRGHRVRQRRSPGRSSPRAELAAGSTIPVPTLSFTSSFTSVRNRSCPFRRSSVRQISLG